MDRERIGIWGSSYSGGHALTVAAIDKRVGCVVSQVPTTSGFLAAQRRVRYDKAQACRRRSRPTAKRAMRACRPPRCAWSMPIPRRRWRIRDTTPCYMTGEAQRCTAWVNEVTLRSLELARAYEPAAYIRRIAPTPLLMIVATGDGLTPADLQQEAFNTAHQPKQFAAAGRPLPVYTEHFERTAARRRLVRAAPALTPKGQDNDDNNNGDKTAGAAWLRCARRPWATPWSGLTGRCTARSRPIWPNLFDPSDPTSALLATLAVFAGGFLARPVGGWLFGRIGDRYGRKFTLVLTMCLLALTSLAIAVLPTYGRRECGHLSCSCAG